MIQRDVAITTTSVGKANSAVHVVLYGGNLSEFSHTQFFLESHREKNAFLLATEICQDECRPTRGFVLVGPLTDHAQDPSLGTDGRLHGQRALTLEREKKITCFHLSMSSSYPSVVNDIIRKQDILSNGNERELTLLLIDWTLTRLFRSFFCIGRRSSDQK